MKKFFSFLRFLPRTAVLQLVSLPQNRRGNEKLNLYLEHKLFFTLFFSLFFFFFFSFRKKPTYLPTYLLKRKNKEKEKKEKRTKKKKQPSYERFTPQGLVCTQAKFAICLCQEESGHFDHLRSTNPGQRSSCTTSSPVSWKKKRSYKVPFDL